MRRLFKAKEVEQDVGLKIIVEVGDIAEETKEVSKREISLYEPDPQQNQLECVFHIIKKEIQLFQATKESWRNFTDIAQQFDQLQWKQKELFI